MTLAYDVKYNDSHDFDFKSVYNQRLVGSTLHTFCDGFTMYIHTGYGGSS